jgi:hypothetical protein
MQLFRETSINKYFSKERGQSPLSFEWSLPYLSPSKKYQMAHITEEQRYTIEVMLLSGYKSNFKKRK